MGNVSKLIIVTYSLDVDLECVHSIGDWSAHILRQVLDALLLEELLYRWLGNLAIICKSVSLETSHHVFLVIVGSLDLGLW